MELVLLKFINGLLFGEVVIDGGGVFDVLLIYKVECVMVDFFALCRRLFAGSVRVVEVNDDNEVKDVIIVYVKMLMLFNKVVVFGYLYEYSKVFFVEA